MLGSIDFENVRSRLAAGEGGYEIVHASPGLGVRRRRLRETRTKSAARPGG
jgi:hypothetical protein